MLACPASQFGSKLLKVPAPFKENDDHNPQRVASRSFFDVSVGRDNVFKGDKYKVSLQRTAINITNKYGLYNFLSTFSGTHCLTPRTLTAQIGLLQKPGRTRCEHRLTTGSCRSCHLGVLTLLAVLVTWRRMMSKPQYPSDSETLSVDKSSNSLSVLSRLS